MRKCRRIENLYSLYYLEMKNRVRKIILLSATIYIGSFMKLNFLSIDSKFNAEDRNIYQYTEIKIYFYTNVFYLQKYPYFQKFKICIVFLYLKI